MSLDRIGTQSGGFTASAYRDRQRLRHNAVQQPATEPLDLTGDSTRFGLTMGTGRGLSESFPHDPNLMYTFGTRFAAWSGREWAAKTVNDAFGQANQTVTEEKFSQVAGASNDAKQAFLAQMGVKAPEADQTVKVTTRKEIPKTVYGLLQPANQTVSIRDLTWSRYTDTVKNNVSELRRLIQSGEVRHFVSNASIKDHIKNYAQDQVKPIKDLMKNNPDKQVGTGLFRGLAVGLMAMDIVRHGKKAYQQAHAEEDGSLGSKLHTWKETFKTAGKYTLRSLGTWEAAGIGMALGRMLLPVSLGVLPIGGILAGAFAGAMAQKALDPLLKTGIKDPYINKTDHLSAGISPDMKPNPFKTKPA